METETKTSEVEADLQTILDHHVMGRPLDPEVKRRVRERAEKIRKQILAMKGEQEIGVEFIRELRGELPES